MSIDRRLRKNCSIQCQFQWQTVLFGIVAIILLSTEAVLSEERKEELAVSVADYPVVESASLGTDLDVPWSEPVVVRDPFEGEFVGIFDRHFFYSRVLNTSARLEVVSLWSPDKIRFLLAYRDRDCNFSSSTFYHQTLSRDCLTSNAALKITDVYLKLGEEVFRLEGSNSRFEVNQKLATALKNSPPGNVDIRLIVENGETVDSKIGEETVEAWQSIY